MIDAVTGRKTWARAASQKWYYKNREHCSALSRAGYQKNKARRVQQIAAWQSEHPGVVYGSSRKHALRRKYGMTEADYAALFTSQAGRCAICHSEDKRKLAVDHSHNTGIVRGLLCHRCNMALGLLKEDPVIVSDAIKYMFDSSQINRIVDAILGGTTVCRIG